MIREAIEKILEMANPETYEINGETYSSQHLQHIPTHYDHPKTLRFAGLDGIAKMVRKEGSWCPGHTIIRVTSPTEVDVISGYLDDQSRDYPYDARAEVPGFRDGYNDHMETIIRLRSRFAPNEGQKYLLQLLQEMNMDQSAQSTDNGVTQTIVARSGVSLNKAVTVKPIVKLQPYRTFLEVEQPESEFLLRIDDKGRVGLFEADGGAWKLAAKENIMRYFEEKLKDMIEEGKVIVTM